LNKVFHRGTLLLLFLILAMVAGGCAPRGAVVNTGWTVVAATPEAAYAVLYGGTVVALDAAEGRELWRYPVAVQRPGGLAGLFSRPDPNAAQPLEATYGAPVVVDDALLAASLDGKLRAFDREKGDLLWELQLEGGVIGGLTVRDGIAYLGTNEDLVYAVDLATREFVWAEPFHSQGWAWGAPAVDAERLYIGSMDHHVYALDRATGTALWTFNTSGAIPGPVALADGVVYLGSVDQKVYAVDAATGQLVWEHSVDHWVMGQPLVLDGYVYVASLDGRVHALSVADGSPRWEAVSVERAVRAGPQALNGGIVVANEAGELWQIETATGDRTRLYPESGEIGKDTGMGAILSAPAVADGWAVIGTTQGYVVALDASASGATERWTYAPN
jgi:outer membrane protein assembly factor BamB